MMKKLLLAFAVFLFVTPAIAGDVYVDGYFRQDGTYVQPHWRSAPDGNPYNNWSTRGNVNPYTGQRGSVSPYRPSEGLRRSPYGRYPSQNCGLLSSCGDRR